MIICFFFVYMVGYIDGFSYIESSFHHWDESYLIMVNDGFDVFLNSVCEYFVEYFLSICIIKIGLKFSFSIGSLWGLGAQLYSHFFRRFYKVLRKGHILIFWGEMFCRYLLNPFGSYLLSVSLYLCLISVSMICLVVRVEY